jgi:hypothetical protein
MWQNTLNIDHIRSPQIVQELLELHEHQDGAAIGVLSGVPGRHIWVFEASRARKGYGHMKYTYASCVFL